MKRRIANLGFVAACLTLLTGCAAAAPASDALACADALRCVEVAADEPINLGVAIVISGSTAFLGEDQIGAMEIALADYGPVHGHEVVLNVEDSLCSAEGGQTAAQKLAADPSIVGVLGTGCSSAAVAALPIIAEAGLSMIAASNTSPSLTEADRAAGGVWQTGYYRTAHNDLFQGRLAAEFAYNELGARRAATIHDGSVYADKLQEVMADVFQELGGVVTHQGAVNVGDTDMRALLTEIAANAPDVLFLPIFQPEGNLVAVQSKEIPGLENVILIGGGGLYTADFPINTGQAAVGMYLLAPWVASDRYDALLQQWRAFHGSDPPSGYHAHMYDAATMLLDAIQASTQADAEGNLLIGLQGIRDYLSGIENFDGITGSLTCGPTGDCATGEAMAAFRIDPENLDGAWPPAVVYP